MVLTVLAHAVDDEKLELEVARSVSARPTAVNLTWGVQQALVKLRDGPQAMLNEASAYLNAATQVRPGWPRLMRRALSSG